MTSGFLKQMRIGVAAASLALAAPMLVLPLSMAAYAQTQDVMLENIVLGPIKISKIEMKGTNATQDQVQTLVSGKMPPADMQAFLKGLSAASISIPSIEISPPEGGNLAFSGIEVEGLSAGEGKLDKFVIGTLVAKDITTPTGPVNATIGEMKIEGLEATDLIAALESGDPEAAIKDPKKFPKFDSLSIGASEMTGPMEGAAAPNNQINIKLGSATLALHDFVGRVASGAEYAFNNIVVKFPEGSEQATQLKGLGYDEVDLSIGGKGSWNKDAKTYAIQDMTFTMANGAALKMSANLGNIDDAFFAGDPQTTMMAMLSAGVSDASVSFENMGLVEKGMAFAGKMQGKSGEQMQQEASGMATAMLPAVLGTDPGAQALAKAIGEFVTSPKNITVKAKAKSGMLTAQDFAAVATPADVFGKIDVEASANQ
jgi:hypothetical protein